MRRIIEKSIGVVTCLTLLVATVSCGSTPTVTTMQSPTSGFSTNVALYTPEIKVTEPQQIIETPSTDIPINKPKKPSYSLDVYYDNETHLLSVVEKVIYFNQTEYVLESIPFTVPNDIQISSVIVNGKAFQSISEINMNSIALTLAEKLVKGDLIEIIIAYKMEIPETKGVLGWTEEKINLADFYPVIPPYKSGVGWLINEPGKVGEYMVYELSDFNVFFTTNIADSFEIFANAHSEKNDNKFIINAPNYRNVVLSICTACVRSEHDYGTFKVIGSFISDDKRKGDEASAIIGQSILYFSDLFGVDYPHDEITIVEADFPDGMEYDGLFFLSKDYFDQYRGGFKNYLTILSIHETAHQWWYGIVGNDQAKEPWLDEALSTYSEFLFLEEFQPDLTIWWWNYRVFDFNPDGLVSSTIYDFNDNRSYINAVYLRGALYLRDLRSNLSSEVFISRLKEYTQKYKGKIADSNGFEGTFISELTSEIKDTREKYFGN